MSRRRTIPVTVTKIRFLVTPRMLSKAFASEPKGSNGMRVSTPEGKTQGERGEGVKEGGGSVILRFDKRVEEMTTYRK